LENTCATIKDLSIGEQSVQDATSMKLGIAQDALGFVRPRLHKMDESRLQFDDA
jgi:hypothetical protein